MSDTESDSSNSSSTSQGWVDLSVFSKYNKIIFTDITAVYPVQEDIATSYEVAESAVYDEKDYVAIMPLCFQDLSSYIVRKPADPNVHTVTFEASTLPYDNNDELYQFLYVKHDTFIAGASTPFKIKTLLSSPSKDLASELLDDDFLFVPRSCQQTNPNFKETIQQLIVSPAENLEENVTAVPKEEIGKTTMQSESEEELRESDENDQNEPTTSQDAPQSTMDLIVKEQSDDSIEGLKVKNDLNDVKDKNVDLLEKILMAKDMLQKTAAEIDKFKNVKEQNIILNQTIVQLEGEKSKLKESFVGKLNDAIKKVAKLEESNKRKEENLKLFAKMFLDKDSINGGDTDLKKAEEELKDVEEQNSVLTKTIAQLEIEKSKLIEGFEELIKRAATDLQEAKEECSNMKKENSILTEKIVQLGVEKSELKASQEKLIEKVTTSVEDLNIEKERNCVLIGTITNLEVQNSDLLASNEKLIEKVTTSVEDLNIEKERNSVLIGTITNLEVQKSDLLASNEKLVEKVICSAKDLNFAKKQSCIPNEKITHLELQKSNLIASNEELRRDVAEGEKKLNDDLKVILSYRKRLQEISKSNGLETTANPATIKFLEKALDEKTAELRAMKASKQLVVEELAIEKEQNDKKLREAAAMIVDFAKQREINDGQVKQIEEHVKEIDRLQSKCTALESTVQLKSCQHIEECEKIKQLSKKHHQDVAKIEELSEQHHQDVAKIEEMSEQQHEDVAKIEDMSEQQHEDVAKIEEMSEQQHEDVAKIEELSKQHHMDVAKIEQLSKQHHMDVEKLKQLSEQRYEDLEKIKQLLQQHQTEFEKIKQLSDQHDEDVKQLSMMECLVGTALCNDVENEDLILQCKDLQQRLELAEMLADDKVIEITRLIAKCSELKERIREQQEMREIGVDAENLCCKEYKVIINDLKARLLASAEIYREQFRKIAKLEKLAKYDVKKQEHDSIAKSQESLNQIVYNTYYGLQKKKVEAIYISDDEVETQRPAIVSTPGPLNDSDTGEPVLKMPQQTAEQCLGAMFGQDLVSNFASELSSNKDELAYLDKANLRYINLLQNASCPVSEKIINEDEAKKYIGENWDFPKGLKNADLLPQGYYPSFLAASSRSAEQEKLPRNKVPGPVFSFISTEVPSMNANNLKEDKNHRYLPSYQTAIGCVPTQDKLFENKSPPLIFNRPAQRPRMPYTEAMETSKTNCRAPAYSNFDAYKRLPDFIIRKDKPPCPVASKNVQKQPPTVCNGDKDKLAFDSFVSTSISEWVRQQEYLKFTATMLEYIKPKEELQSSVYADEWIRQPLPSYEDTSRLVRQPLPSYEDTSRLGRQPLPSYEDASRLGRQPEVLQSLSTASTSGWARQQKGLQSSSTASTSGWARQQKGLQSSSTASRSGWARQQEELQSSRASTSQTPSTRADECRKRLFNMGATSLDKKSIWKPSVNPEDVYFATSCPTCRQEIFTCGNDFTFMANHMESAHKQTLCPICRMVFSTDRLSQTHFKIHVEAHFE